MVYKRYRVKGKHNETHRTRTKVIDALSSDNALSIAINELNLLEPIEIEFIPPSPATERQLAYAKDLGINIPDNATLDDMCTLISNIVDYDDYSKPSQGLIDFAEGRKLIFNPYVGKKQLYNIVFYNLPLEDQAAFFCFSVYRWLVDDRQANLDCSPHKELFYSFAKEHLENKSFIQSLNRYEGKDLRFFGKLRRYNIDNTYNEFNGGSTNTMAYKAAADFICSKFGVNNRNIKNIYPSQESKTNKISIAISKIRELLRNKLLSFFQTRHH